MTTKEQWRRRLLAARASRVPVDPAVFVDPVQALLPAGVRRVAAYASVGPEPGTGPLLLTLAAAGLEVLLPVLRADLDLDWTAYDGRLVAADRGLVEPPGDRLGMDAVRGAGLVVVPALAVDRAGQRLGRGGGSYDRALLRVPAAVEVVALLFEGELVERLPAEPHDRPVSAVALPSGLVRVGGASAGGREPVP